MEDSYLKLASDVYNLTREEVRKVKHPIILDTLLASVIICRLVEVTGKSIDQIMAEISFSASSIRGSDE